jgi:hypothetical protein
MSNLSTRSGKAVIGLAAALASVTAIPAAAAAQDEVAEMAKVRVLHGAGDAPAVDVYAGGDLVLEGLEYAEISDYLEVPGGEYQIQVVPTGATLDEGPIVIDAPLTFDAGTMTTVAATGSLGGGIVPQVLPDARPAPRTQVRVRFSFDAAVDIDSEAALSRLASEAPATSTCWLRDQTAPARTPSPSTSLTSTDAGTASVFAVGGLRMAHGRTGRRPPWRACVSVTSRPTLRTWMSRQRRGHPHGRPGGVISDYLYVPAGTYQIQVVPAGASLEEGPVVIDAPLTFEGGTLTTVAATNELANITPVVLTDDPAPIADEAQIRVVHLSADAPKVDVAPDGSDVKGAIFKNLNYGKAKGYATVPAGEYDLEVRPAGKKQAAFDIPALTLEAGKSYSAMAIGQLGSGSFTVILVEDAAA